MNIVLTGASRGIGFETAKALAYQEIKSLYLISRRQSQLAKLKEEIFSINQKVKVVCIAEDLSTLVKDSENLIKYIDAQSIDIVINNAGILVNKPFAEITSTEIFQMFDVNFFAAAELVRILLDQLLKSKSSHVVNIGSMGGVQGSSKYSGLSYYSAAKAAMAVMTECLATEFKDTSLHFNCLALGAVQTEMLSEAFSGYQAPVDSKTMGEYIANFAMNGHNIFNGKILQVAMTNP